MEISGITGWRKTQRYALTFARQNRKPAGEKQLAEPPKFLTLVRIPRWSNKSRDGADDTTCSTSLTARLCPRKSWLGRVSPNGRRSSWGR